MALGKKTGGRRRGTPNKANAAREAKIASEGATPLDVMLDNMRFAYDEAGKVLAKVMGLSSEEGAGAIDVFKEMLRFRQIAQDCAKDAAPYVHPKLASVTHKGDKENPLRLLLDAIDGETRGLPGKGKP